MPDFPTQQDLFRVGRDEMLARRALLTRDVIEREGTDANILTAAMSSVGDEVTGQLVRVQASLTLGAARGQALDRWVYDRYGLLRGNAAPALGSVDFTTSLPNPAGFNIPQGLKLQTADGLQFITTAAAVFPAAATGPITVAVRSLSAGSNQQARIGTITSIIGVVTGAAADLAVTNPTATAGAADREKDEDLIDRARLFFTTVRRATKSAIREQALRHPNVRYATVFEVLDAFGRPAKVVELVVADQFTDILVRRDTLPVTYETQSQALATEVFLSLEETRAAGIHVSTRVASVVLQSVVLALSYRAGVDVPQVALKARAAVVSTVNALSPGDTLTTELLVDALRRVPELLVSGDEILSPSGDVVPAILEVIRTELGLVSVSNTV